MRESDLYPPLRFRFTHEPDAARYANPADPDGWWVYDEAAITGLPFTKLAALEAEMFPLYLVDVMQGVRDNSILGYHAASWLGVHLADPGKAGPYADWSPRAVLVFFEPLPGTAPEADADPLDTAPSPASSPAE